MFRQIIIGCIVVLCSCSAWGMTTPVYNVTELLPLRGKNGCIYDINVNGDAVGAADIGPYNGRHALLFSQGVLTDLSYRVFGPNPEQSIAIAINDRGQIVGSRWGTGGAYVYDHGSVSNFIQGMYFASDINNQGQVIGTNIPYGGFLYENDTLKLLSQNPPYSPTISEALAINDHGLIVGCADDNRGVTYQNGQVLSLGTLGGSMSRPSDVNNKGQIVGDSLTSANQMRAFLYTQGEMQNLGVLPGTTESHAYAINDAGQIVGASSDRAFLYSNGKMYDLNTLTPSLSGWKLTAALAINASGCIAVNGVNSVGETGNFILTPVPEPSSLILVAIGLGFVFITGLRKSSKGNR